MKWALLWLYLISFVYNDAVVDAIEDDLAWFSRTFGYSPRKPRPAVRQNCDNNCLCGQAGGDNRRIVGGNEVPAGRYPWMALVQFSNVDETFTCGGTVLNNKYVLTAAHCVPDIETNTTVFLNLTVVSEPGEYKIEILAESVYVHENYVPVQLENDLALVKLTESIDTTRMSPICLPTTISTYDGIDAIAVGWGLTTQTGSASDVLLETGLPVAPHADCEQEYGELPEYMLCAGTKEGGHSICQGDSGGPLQMLNDTIGAYVHLGTSSFVANPCGKPQGYSVFAKTDYYYNWIIENTADACYCPEPPATDSVRQTHRNLMRGKL